jgi:hypothetical protein
MSGVRPGFPPTTSLRENERGQYRLTHEVRNPKPIGHYVRLLKKFTHLNEEDLKDLQKVVDQRFQQLKAPVSATCLR